MCMCVAQHLRLSVSVGRLTVHASLLGLILAWTVSGQSKA